MDLIYMNEYKEDIGVILDYDLDMAFGHDENNFECRIQSNNHCCKPGYYLYIDGTEYGGIIDSIESDTDAKEVVYIGRTWQGILNSKVIEPDNGSAYLTVSGEANEVIASLLSRVMLTAFFEADSTNSGLTIRSYKMNRYISAYDGIRKMLNTADGKLRFKFKDGKIVLSAVSKQNYTQDEEFDSDQVGFKVKKNYKTVNHLICLGSGELENRMVRHLYADSTGNISDIQSQFGMDEYTATYDFPSVESEAELVESGTERLKELWGQDELSINLGNEDETYDVGDIVGAYDNITKISVSAEIIKKIVVIKSGKVKISYEVGE